MKHTPVFENLQGRDSLLIADQIRVGAHIEGLEEGTRLTPTWAGWMSDSLEVVQDWKIDTLRYYKKTHKSDIEITTTLTSFNEGHYTIPDLEVERWFSDGIVDTLCFDGRGIDYCTMPVDTTTFQLHDLKPQIQYPITFAEVLPWIGGGIGLAGLIVLAVLLFRRWLHRRDEAVLQREPAHIVALRKLDTWRGDKYWSADKQKQFYSGVTDTLREYIAARYDIGAMEMTTAELFAALKNVEVDKDLKAALQHLFETADFVKFAKLTLPREENAGVVPLAVQFVTNTYQQELEDDAPAPEKK
ncbi:MAG: hypothetical protein J6Y32_08220 [Bacteroidales bacterium]|nr:hypothetical protein [Bacteroidales bacterium]